MGPESERDGLEAGLKTTAPAADRIRGWYRLGERVRSYA